MIAPPHVQAASFAKAILTDITSILFLACAGRKVSTNIRAPAWQWPQMLTNDRSAQAR
jgi:hypothetical protein